jgi:DNA topoisomerase-1|tara:strand:- start:110 stop:853 length:744 start_codon:yes stop_codon:yes gene_type:complete
MDIKIPPAYKNIHIYNDGENDKILAYGYDNKNRKQVIYNPEFIKKQNEKKYKKILKLNKIFKTIIEDINIIINEKKYKNNYEIAIIIYLIINCGFRIGNEKYKCENNSYGITTLEYKHLTFKHNKLIIDFIGKKGVQNISECTNENIIKFLKKGKKNNNENDKIFTKTSYDVNMFLKKYNNKITSKDLRTWNANNLLLKYIKTPEIKTHKNPVKKAIEKVSEQLHNSYHICLKSYINPILIEKLKEK